jgi:phosphomannomutase
MIDPALIRKRRFRVVLDCVNAAGGLIVPRFLKGLGCDVIEMNCECSGVFAHTPEPIPENLTDLAARVKAERADLGIAVDPDVDRLVLMTEEGEPYSEEYTVASAVKFVLKKVSGQEGMPPGGSGAARSGGELAEKVVVNLSTTRAVEDIAREFGAEVIRTPVGEINVARQMKAVGAVIGGEGSGGVILPAVHLGRDAVVGIGLILQLLTEHGGTISSLKRSLPQYFIAKGRIELGTREPDRLLKALVQHHGTEGRVNLDDGLKIDFPEYWVHLRKSNTEPIVRVIAEAKSVQKAREIVEDFRREITQLD